MSEGVHGELCGKNGGEDEVETVQQNTQIRSRSFIR